MTANRFRFRAWDERQKVMHYDFQFIKSGEEGNDWIVFTSDKQRIGEKWKPHPFENPYFQQQFKIMQSTGLTDKNGKEIYEGDILQLNIPHSEEMVGEFGKVQVKFGNYDDSEIEYGSSGIGWFVTGFHGYERRNYRKDSYQIGEQAPDWSLDRCLHWEVVGNIYENPELVKGDIKYG